MKTEMGAAPYATHISSPEGGEWRPIDSLTNIIREEDINQRPYGKGENYIAFKFNDGRIWDSIIGWRDAHPAQSKQLRRNVFNEASEIIYGDREQTYGHPAKNLENIARQWTAYVHQKYGGAVVFTPEDVCWMMVDLKKCRQMNTSKRDNLVDAIGYIGLIERCE